MQVHINKLWMVANQLTNINHQKNYEDLVFTFLKNLPPSLHTLTVSLNVHTDQLFMKFVYEQLLQKEL